MSEKKFVYISVNGTVKSYSVNVVRGYDTEGDVNSVILKVVVAGVGYESRSGIMESAVMGLQKQLPYGIRIICCQSCRHGNFCPYGDQENEIFCLNGYAPKDKMDVVDIFNTVGHENVLKKELLFWCDDYMAMDEGHCTYNDSDFWKPPLWGD